MFSSLPSWQQIGLAISVSENAVLFVLLPIWILALLTDRSRRFPAVYSIWATAVPFFFMADALLAYVQYKPLYDDGQLSLLTRGVVTGIIAGLAGMVAWVPYMLRSRKVRETFSS